MNEGLILLFALASIWFSFELYRARTKQIQKQKEEDEKRSEEWLYYQRAAIDLLKEGKDPEDNPEVFDYEASEKRKAEAIAKLFSSGAKAAGCVKPSKSMALVGGMALGYIMTRHMRRF